MTKTISKITRKSKTTTMTRRILRPLAAVALCFGVLLGSSGSAHAWYKIKNSTPNTVWMTHAFNAWNTVVCGWNDNCPDATTSGWRIEGWWMIAPGATATIQTKNFGNAYHQIYVHDLVGHVWNGNGGAWGTPDSAFSRCEGLFTELNMPYYGYMRIRTSVCCGLGCGPDNHTTNLIL